MLRDEICQVIHSILIEKKQLVCLFTVFEPLILCLIHRRNLYIISVDLTGEISWLIVPKSAE